jgi:hypothetical protein
MFIKQYENPRRTIIDLRISKRNFKGNDSSSIYNCYGQNKFYVVDYATDYENVKDLKFRIIQITPTYYFTN